MGGTRSGGGGGGGLELLGIREGSGAPWVRNSTEMVKPNASCRSILFWALSRMREVKLED